MQRGEESGKEIVKERRKRKEEKDKGSKEGPRKEEGR